MLSTFVTSRRVLASILTLWGVINLATIGVTCEATLCAANCTWTTNDSGACARNDSANCYVSCQSGPTSCTANGTFYSGNPTNVFVAGGSQLKGSPNNVDCWRPQSCSLTTKDDTACRQLLGVYVCSGQQVGNSCRYCTSVNGDWVPYPNQNLAACSE